MERADWLMLPVASNGGITNPLVSVAYATAGISWTFMMFAASELKLGDEHRKYITTILQLPDIIVGRAEFGAIKF